MRLFISGPRLPGGFHVGAVSASIRPQPWAIRLGLNLLLVALFVAGLATLAVLFVILKDVILAGPAPAFR